ncbi:pyridoxamine 5'-phosphate oxidase family protein [Pendulispora brunnea]|uniref:Pyridoxamine 5'-phosphate oxidase family protein n=1 Tax=Pendulispora brunnea TaxID=2905690 RepID=A0ABZ2JZ37_9BACT
MMGALSAKEADEVLESQSLGRIGYIADGKPWIVPVTYIYDGTCAYVHSAEGSKVVAMRSNPHICFEVEDVVDMGHWRSVVAQGVFEELWRDDEERVMDLLATRFAPPFSWGDPAAPPRHEEAHRGEGVVRPHPLSHSFLRKDRTLPARGALIPRARKVYTYAHGLHKFRSTARHRTRNREAWAVLLGCSIGGFT